MLKVSHREWEFRLSIIRRKKLVNGMKISIMGLLREKFIMVQRLECSVNTARKKVTRHQIIQMEYLSIVIRRRVALKVT